MTQEELYRIIALDESYRIERTVSTSNMDKFQEAICAFANDLPGSRKKGYLLIGVSDDGKINGLKVDDALMKRIIAIRSDGNIYPGGLYGQARPENFPHVNDYRNTVVAEMMKTLNYVNMFNHGISEVQELLKENNSPSAEFNVSYVTTFSVVVRDEEKFDYSASAHQLFTNCSVQTKLLIMSLKDSQLSTSELQLFTNCSLQSKQLFIKQFIAPNLENGIIVMTHPETPHHPRQKYYLTELGRAVLELFLEEEQKR